MTTESRALIEDGEEGREADKPKRRTAKPAPEPEPERDPYEPTSAEIAQALNRGVDVPEIEPEEMAAALVGRIMAVEDQEQVLTPITPVTAYQVAERPLKITGYQPRKSYYLDGWGVYLLIDAVALDTGEVLLIHCGAVNVVGQLLRAAALNALEVPVKFEQRTSQANPDRTLLWLRPAELPPQQ